MHCNVFGKAGIYDWSLLNGAHGIKAFSFFFLSYIQLSAAFNYMNCSCSVIRTINTFYLFLNNLVLKYWVLYVGLDFFWLFLQVPANFLRKLWFLLPFISVFLPLDHDVSFGLKWLLFSLQMYKAYNLHSVKK